MFALCNLKPQVAKITRQHFTPKKSSETCLKLLWLSIHQKNMCVQNIHIFISHASLPTHRIPDMHLRSRELGQFLFPLHWHVPWCRIECKDLTGRWEGSLTPYAYNLKKQSAAARPPHSKASSTGRFRLLHEKCKANAKRVFCTATSTQHCASAHWLRPWSLSLVNWALLFLQFPSWDQFRSAVSMALGKRTPCHNGDSLYPRLQINGANGLWLSVGEIFQSRNVPARPITTSLLYPQVWVSARNSCEQNEMLTCQAAPWIVRHYFPLACEQSQLMANTQVNHPVGPSLFVFFHRCSVKFLALLGCSAALQLGTETTCLTVWKVKYLKYPCIISFWVWLFQHWAEAGRLRPPRQQTWKWSDTPNYALQRSERCSPGIIWKWKSWQVGNLPNTLTPTSNRIGWQPRAVVERFALQVQDEVGSWLMADRSTETRPPLAFFFSR